MVACPMAKDELVGNMPTEKLITCLSDDLELNKEELEISLIHSVKVFTQFE